jgi:hypothetical protein
MDFFAFFSAIGGFLFFFWDHRTAFFDCCFVVCCVIARRVWHRLHGIGDIYFILSGLVWFGRFLRGWCESRGCVRVAFISSSLPLSPRGCGRVGWTADVCE